MILIKIILFLVFINIFNNSSEANEIILKYIHDKTEIGVQEIEFVDCSGDKEKHFIKEDEPPAFIIPTDKIKAMQIVHYFCEDFYQPFDININVKQDYSKQLRKLYSNNIRKTFAVYLDDEMVSLLTILEPKGRFDIGFGCLTFERAVAIALNLGYKVKYEEICINKKKRVEKLSLKYKFKEKKEYETLDNSVLWIISEKAELYNDVKEKKVISTIPEGKIVEQYYNDYLSDFERNSEYLKVVYQNKVGWIKADSAISFLSTLDNDVFLQKFFENHEQFYHSHLIAKGAISKREAIRQLYIKEAKNRFLNEEEFRRWYLKTFKKPFKE